MKILKILKNFHPQKFMLYGILSYGCLKSMQGKYGNISKMELKGYGLFYVDGKENTLLPLRSFYLPWLGL